MDLSAAAILSTIVGVVAYSLGKAAGKRKGAEESFHPVHSEGYYHGWLARHAEQPLEDTRVHPDVLKELVPSLQSPDQEISHWSWNADHLTFEEHRQQQVADLNAELRKQLTKNDSPRKV